MARADPLPRDRVPTKGEIRGTYERIADSFAASRKEPWTQVVAFVDSLPTGSRVLDVGCGNGRHSAILASRGHTSFAVDFSRGLLERARVTGAPRIRWIEAEATRLPLRDASADAALCIAVLHHLPTLEDRVAALREIRRVLVPGGALLASVWDLDHPRFADLLVRRASDPPEERGDALVPWPLPDGSVALRYYHLFQEDELRRLIIESGLLGETFFKAAGNVFVKARPHG